MNVTNIGHQTNVINQYIVHQHSSGFSHFERMQCSDEMPNELYQAPLHINIQDEMNEGISAQYPSYGPTKLFDDGNNGENYIEIGDGSLSGNLLMLDNVNQPVEPPFPFVHRAMSMASSNYNMPGGRQVAQMSNMVGPNVNAPSQFLRSGQKNQA